jgi:hypothetical protein
MNILAFEYMESKRADGVENLDQCKDYQNYFAYFNLSNFLNKMNHHGIVRRKNSKRIKFRP